jgi:hypothetical protein
MTAPNQHQNVQVERHETTFAYDVQHGMIEFALVVASQQHLKYSQCFSAASRTVHFAGENGPFCRGKRSVLQGKTIRFAGGKNDMSAHQLPAVGVRTSQG